MAGSLIPGLGTPDAVTPPSGVNTGNGWMDTLQNAFAFTVSKAVDAEFIRKTTINNDPTNWPGYNQFGDPFQRGAPSNVAPQAATGMSVKTMVLIGGGVLLVVLLLVRR